MPTNRETLYLQQVLQMNPLEQAADILTIRRTFQNKGECVPLFLEEHPIHNRHQVASDLLDSLRHDFWSLEKQQLIEKLDELDFDNWPDLAVSLNRMKAVAERRDSFQRLHEHPNCFPQFLDGFKQLVIAAPRKAVDIRRQELQKARSGMAHPVYRSSREFQRIAKSIENDFPELFVLEQEWLKDIARKKRKLYLPKGTTSVVFHSLFAFGLYLYKPRFSFAFLTGWVIAILIKFLRTGFEK